jgi:hypothetical protein
MHATESEHKRLEMNAKTTLNCLKRSRKIRDFEISRIFVGEIKIVVTTLSGAEEILQLRSKYGEKVVNKTIRDRFSPSLESSEVGKDELVVAVA